MTLAGELGPHLEPTWSVSRLCAEIKEVLSGVFPGLWVAGEVQRVHESRRGHVYFELVEKDERDGIQGKIDAVMWRGNWQRAQRLLAASDQELAEGMEIRCHGGVDFYGAGGRLQLVVDTVDPVFTLGLLEKRRRETLAALQAAGLMELNRSLPLAALPLRVALVTSEGSAAYHDFVTTLAESGYGFRVFLVHASVQGRTAERELVSALELAARADGAYAVDCAVVVRGGGSRSDLAVFDSRGVAEAVARAPVPVITGLGHEIDQAIADRVAHTAVKTPTKAAELLIERVAGCDLALAELRRELSAAARERLRDGREALGRAEGRAELARARLGTASARLDEHARTLARVARTRLREAARRRRELARRLAVEAPRLLARRAAGPPAAGRRLAALAGGRLREATARLEGLERLARELAPQRTLARGYSITRRDDGGLITGPGAVTAGQRITTTTAGGVFASRVEED